LCFGIIFSIGKYDTAFSGKSIYSAVNKPISSEAKFKLSNVIIFGSVEKPLSVNKNVGIGVISLDLSSGNLKIKSIKFDSEPIKVEGLKKDFRISAINLDTDYPSSGKINLETGKIDLSVGIVLEMKIGSSYEKISLVIPLAGTLNRKAGVLDLKGAATIPPDKLENPLPAELIISATSM
jgi:hypothetical protein